MNDLLSKKEKEKYEKMWEVSQYRLNSPGVQALPIFFDEFQGKIQPGDTITDFGCGMGLSAIAFRQKQLSVQLVDITETALNDEVKNLIHIDPLITFTECSLWQLPKSVEPTDWIYCADVLEHIPEEKVDAVLKGLSARTKKGGMLQIFHEEETFGDMIEETLHLTVQPEEWWLKKLNKHWEVLAVAPIYPKIRVCYLLGSPKN